MTIWTGWAAPSSVALAFWRSCGDRCSYRRVLDAAGEGDSASLSARVYVRAVKVDIQVPVIRTMCSTAWPLQNDTGGGGGTGNIAMQECFTKTFKNQKHCSSSLRQLVSWTLYVLQLERSYYPFNLRFCHIGSSGTSLFWKTHWNPVHTDNTTAIESLPNTSLPRETSCPVLHREFIFPSFSIILDQLGQLPYQCYCSSKWLNQHSHAYHFK